MGFDDIDVAPFIVPPLTTISQSGFEMGRVAANLLFQVRASDPLVLASVVTLVASVGVAASATAVRQGLRIDPASALRDE